jgi:hypothetical protein
VGASILYPIRVQGFAGIKIRVLLHPIQIHPIQFLITTKEGEREREQKNPRKQERRNPNPPPPSPSPSPSPEGERESRAEQKNPRNRRGENQGFAWQAMAFFTSSSSSCSSIP